MQDETTPCDRLGPSLAKKVLRIHFKATDNQLRGFFWVPLGRAEGVGGTQPLVVPALTCTDLLPLPTSSALRERKVQ